MPDCKLCGDEGRLIKAHIIPESLYGPLLRESKIPRVYSTAPDAFPKRARTGIYDDGILCASCDNRIGKWDNYAQEILLKPLSDFGPPDRLVAQECFSIQGLDCRRFKLFFVSLIWRADQSRHEFFSGVDLGVKWRDRAKEMIIAEGPGNPEEFGVTLVRYEHRLAEGTIYNPERVRSDSLNLYRFSLGMYVAMIKVDRKLFQATIRPFVLGANSPFCVALFNYEESRIYKDILRHVRNGVLSKRRGR